MAEETEFRDPPLSRDSRTLATQTGELIRQKIISGEFPAGKPLPSERELSEMLAVSRVPVREALKALEYLGVVRQVRGKGVFVSEPDPVALFAKIGPLLAAPGSGTVRDLYEVRLVIESWCASEAAKHRNPALLAKLEGALLDDSPESLTPENVTSQAELFHRTVCEMSENRIAVLFQSLAAELLRESVRLAPWSLERCLASARDHRVIFEAIKAGNSEQAAKAMHDHLSAAESRNLHALEGVP